MPPDDCTLVPRWLYCDLIKHPMDDFFSKSIKARIDPNEEKCNIFFF